MRNVLGLTLLLLYGTAYAVAAIAWFVAALYLLRTVANRQPGVRLFSAPLAYCPVNIVFRPDLLTDRGQACRRRFGLFGMVFAGALGAGIALAGLARWLA